MFQPDFPLAQARLRKSDSSRYRRLDTPVKRGAEDAFGRWVRGEEGRGREEGGEGLGLGRTVRCELRGVNGGTWPRSTIAGS